MSNGEGFMVRTAERSDVPALLALLNPYMQETFGTPWQGSAEAINRDGFGNEFDTVVAVSGTAQIIGFASWTWSYDLHHCITGGDIIDLYVLPIHRGRGVAPALIFAIASQILRKGGKYVKGKAIENRVVQRLYKRLAVCFPGADCVVGGRAFRCLTELVGQPPKRAARSLPDKSWNYEP